MTNFKGHIKYGWYTHVITTIIILPITIYNNIPLELIISLIGISLPITLFGSILPDIDHPSSKTYRIFRYILLCTTIIFLSIIIGQYQNEIQNILSQIITGTITTESISIIIACFSLIIGMTTIFLFEKIRPPHRGITHNISFGLIISIIFALIIWQSFTIIISQNYNVISPIILSTYLFLGFCSHLYADDMII